MITEKELREFKNPTIEEAAKMISEALRKEVDMLKSIMEISKETLEKYGE